MALESDYYAKLNVTVLDHKTEIEQNKNDISRSIDRALIEKDPNNKTQTGMEKFGEVPISAFPVWVFL